MASYVWWRLIVVIIGCVSMQKPVFSEPQTNLLGKGCSQYNATNLPDFFRRLNASFDDLRNQLSNQDKRFATTKQAVYAMIECRKYLSRADCVSCYDAAVSLIRTCSGANGARVTYDGCFLRYESNNFYQDTTLPGNAEICGNRTASQPNALSPVTLQLLNDLSIATPRISDFFAATKREVSGVTVYGVAQCAETITESGCQDCLTVAHKNIEGCLPKYAEGKAVDAACFMRYSDRDFFADNKTTDITPFLGGGGSSNKKKAAIIGSVVGGVGLLLIVLAFFLWYRLSRKPKAAERGNILGATELRGPVSYRFKDLKIATKDFNESNKLGEGGFGDVYKGTLTNGNVVAVKKLAMISSRAKADFETEVRLISNVHHRNLIRLLGCSNKGAELLLVYEYMSNGSLERYLYEYAIHGHLTEKVDVYSFGVVVLEIISGRRSNDVQIEPVTEYLLEQAWKLHETGTPQKLVDETLDPNEYNEQEVKKIIEIALICTQSPANLRPSMSEVVVMLLSDRSTDTRTPSRPTIISMDKSTPVDTSMTTGSSASNATNTFSDFTGR
ncbi:hypothetical protein HAX54_021886 [Datura stramonium]|uniref:Cysteine-rich receptor-like protein kinase 2 n=1 Tax=Datura stramonium TaxID=4076 RepID=A0ABS8S647_DATST|nr:hypothetical protein [Datura stramonium]